MTGTGTPLG